MAVEEVEVMVTEEEEVMEEVEVMEMEEVGAEVVKVPLEGLEVIILLFTYFIAKILSDIHRCRWCRWCWS